MACVSLVTRSCRESVMNKRRKKGGRLRALDVADRCVDFALALFVVPLLAISLVALYEAGEVARSGAMMVAIAEKVDDDSIEDLFEENGNVVAWLRVAGTNINYPVMRAKNNSWYLVRDYNGDYSPAGSLFVDYRNEPFEDDCTVIYGHRMSGDMMFGEIAKFADRQFLEEHRSGELKTRNGVAELYFVEYAEVNTAAREIYAVGDYRNERNREVIARIGKESGMASVAEMDENDQILILSTCDKTRRNYRNVLVAKVDWR